MSVQATLFGSVPVAALEPGILEVPDVGVRGARCVPCPEPSCAAPVGSPCKRPSGHDYYGSSQGAVHASRRELAGRVRIAGLACALCGTPDGPDHYVAPVSPSAEAEGLGLAGVQACQSCVQARAEAGGQPYAPVYGYGTGVEA